MKSSIKTLLGAAALVLATATTAIADPINGVIAFSGFSTLNSTSTGIDSFSGVTVGYADGDFTGVSGTVFMGPNTASSSDDWIFNSPTGYSGTFWSIDDFVFVLMSSSGGLSGSFVNAGGWGYVWNTNDFAGTLAKGSWGFSTQNPQVGQNTFFFSATTSVPDGGTTALLLGVALLGLGVAARRKL